MVKFYFESIIPQVLDHSYVKSSFSTITRYLDKWHMKDTFQLKILPTWINVGLELAPRHLTYCSMLFFLSSKPSFCYSNNFCRNLFTFLCLKDVNPANYFFCFPARTFLFQPSLPYFHKTLVLVNGENY